MKYRKITALLCAAAAACSAISFPAVHAADYAAEKARVSVHDPSIIKDSSGTYYVFGSHIDAAKSTDLQSWRTFTNGYTTPNNKVFGDLSGNLKKAFAWAGEDLGDCEGGFAVWAPDVVWDADYINQDGTKGAYLMYFCTSSDYRTSVISFAASRNIEGPYQFVDTLIYSGFTDTTVTWGNARKTVNRRYSSTNIPELTASGEVTMNAQWFSNHLYNNQLFPNAIDPTIYYDTDGKMYMCYGSWSGGIFTLEMDPQTGKCIHPESGTTADGRMIDSYFGTKISGGYGKSGEGPFIEYNEDTGFYYLWVTYGELFSAGGYNMRVGRSRSPLGPFTDPAGRNMVLESNSNLDAVGLKVMTNYIFGSLPRAYMACGHNSVLKDDDGQWYLFNHARFDDGTEYHEVRVHAMRFNEAGWPVVMPYEYSGETWSDTGFDSQALCGSYTFINHGNATDGKITSSVPVTLNADGSISGAVSGTWSEAYDSAAAVFTIDNVKYQGYFNPQFDESGTGTRVMTFTAVGSNNQTIWGAAQQPWKGSERSSLYNHFTGSRYYYRTPPVQQPDAASVIPGTDLFAGIPYLITNVNSGLLMEADAVDPQEGAAIDQYRPRGNKSGDASQEFRIVMVNDTDCALISMANEKLAVTVNGNSAENGLEISLEPFNGSDAQCWRLVRYGSYYGIVSKCSDYTAGLDVFEWSTKDGAPIKQWNLWGGECQLWKIQPTYAQLLASEYALKSCDSALFIGNDSRSDTLKPLPAAQQNNNNPISWKCSGTDSGAFIITDCYARTLVVRDGALCLTKQPLASDGMEFRFFCHADGSYSLVTPDDLAVTAGADGYTLEPLKGSKNQCFLPLCSPIIMTERRLFGDVNCDDSVDVSDAVLLARLLAEDSEAVISEQGFRNADCNQNGSPDRDDLMMILQAIAMMIELPES